MVILKPEKIAKRCKFAVIILYMSTQDTYNQWSQNRTSLTSLIVNLMKYAQRHPKNTSYRRGFESYALWRPRAFSTVLPKNRSEALFAELYTLGTPQQSISSRSVDNDDNLYYGGRDETDLGHKNSELQRVLSKSVGSDRFSESFDLAEIPQESFGSGNRFFATSSRFVAQDDSQNDWDSQQSDFGIGLDRFAFVRLQNRTSQGGVQSQEAGTPQLSSVDLFSRKNQNGLARDIESWQYSYDNRGRRIPAGMFEQDSSLPLSYSSQGRFGILRSRFDRNPRGENGWICYRGEDDKTHSRENSIVALSAFSPGWLAICLVYLSAIQLQKATSLCCYSPTRQSKQGRTANPVQIQKLLLSHVYYQPGFACPYDLALLSQAGSSRTRYPRAQGKFPFGQNPDQQLLGQSGPLYPDTPCLRPYPMVQASLLAIQMEVFEFANDSHRALGFARSIGLLRRDQRTQSSSQLCSSGALQASPQEYRTFENSQNLTTLSKLRLTTSSKPRLNYGDSLFFQD